MLGLCGPTREYCIGNRECKSERRRGLQPSNGQRQMGKECMEGGAFSAITDKDRWEGKSKTRWSPTYPAKRWASEKSSKMAEQQ